MAHFAQLDGNNIVVYVTVVDNKWITDDDGIEHEEWGISYLQDIFGRFTNWVQTSYNGSFRKNFAAIGYTYDEVNDMFYSPTPYDSWTLNISTGQWEPPTSYPNDGRQYLWEESIQQWQDMNTTVSRLQFALRFALDERIAIRTSTDSVVMDFDKLMSLAENVDVTNSTTMQGVEYLESIGVIASGRAAEILALPS